MASDWLPYYCREKRYGTMIEVVQKSGNDDKLKLQHGVALFLLHRVNEAINILEPIITNSSVSLGAANVCLIAHNLCEVIDKEAVSHLEWRILDEEEKVGEQSLYYAALSLLQIGKAEKSSDYLNKLLEKDPSSVTGLALKGWLELSLGKIKNASQAFKVALEKDKSNIEAQLGEIAIISVKDGISKINQLIVRYPSSTPPLEIKMKLQLSIKDWTLVIDTANRILSLQPNNLPALQIKTLHQIVIEGNYEDGCLNLHRIVQELEKHVNASSNELLFPVKLFSHICGRHSRVLTETIRLAEKAVSLYPTLPDALLELAEQFCMNNQISEASKIYRSVTKLDDSSVKALTGLTNIQFIESGLTDQVQQQVEFLAEVAGPDLSPELLLLRARCEAKDPTALLDKAVKAKLSSASLQKYGPQYFVELDPDFLMEVAKQFPENIEGTKKRIKVLEAITDACPGLAIALLYLAKSLAFCEKYSDAVEILQRLLREIEPSNAEAHLVLAQILVEQEQFTEAQTCLEQGLSCNLQIQERPLYHLLVGTMQRNQGDHSACVKSMQTALTANNGDYKLNLREIGSLYLELSTSLMALDQPEEAGKILNDANKILSGTEQESRLTIANSDLAVFRGDYMMALTLLSSIRSEQNYYLQACKKMADIHLNKLKDAQAYADCFRQLVDSKPTTENLIMLGDAYMAIQEPDLAVKTYEKAMQHSASDPKLSCRLGRVLVSTHQYGKAVKCFREAGQEGCIELAELLVRLGQFDSAEAALKDTPLTQKALVLAKVHEKAGNVNKALKVLEEVRETLGSSDVNLAAKTCLQMAEYCSMLRDHDTAINHYKRALIYQPDDAHAQISLARLYMQVNDWSSCQALCSSLLNKDPNNEPALLMLADLAYRRVDFNDAALHFATLLERHPDYWIALARLIEVKRRTAQLPDVKSFLEAATNIAPNEPGLSYCTGLYDWYSGNTNSALHHFNSARHDNEWGQQALHNMVELCLEGDDGISTATRLLSQMKPQSPDEEINVRLLHDLILLSSKDKQDIDIAMADLAALVSQDTLRVGAILGLATGYVLQKQIPRARNALKRIAKATWLVEEAEYLERCWLLLADLHVQNGKNESAIELLRRVLVHNQSCYRAHELLGLIAEKDQKYLEAGAQYQQAWKLSGETDPALGYKLAFNLLKAKKYAYAISTCQSVLKLNPDYPKIRKDILEKAISHLRT
uniref:Tetratricopeptide repeat protein 21B n=2 Tax=Clastoptera arizonana TaxID=38151 RepID=A0A1B6BXL6_9HEMI